MIRPYREHFLRKRPDGDTLSWMTYMDLSLRLPELLLMRVDKMAMAHSVEARVPFLDHRIVEFSLGLSESQKIKNGELKFLLKNTLSRVLPQEILRRKKMGFGDPMQNWFAHPKLLRWTLTEAKKFEKMELLDTEELSKFLKNGGDLFSFLNFFLWADQIGLKAG